MKIGLDFDGVLADAGELKSITAKKLYNIHIPSSNFKKELVVGKGVLSAFQYESIQKIIYGTRETGLLLKPVKGMLIFLQKLIDDGHEITIITSRTEATLEIAKEWSEKRGLNLEFIGVGYGKEKTNATYGFDVYIDDDLDKLLPLHGKVKNLFLFSWGYNKHIDEKNIAKRINSWKDFYKKIQSL